MRRLSVRGTLRRLARIGAILCCGSVLTGCHTSVTPPDHPINPQVVYLCDYGVHSSLLLPMGDRKYVEYLFGDWNWAALGHNTAFDAVGALFLSRQSTLGRRFVLQSAPNKMPVPIDGPRSEVPIIVNGDDCDALVQRLQARWEVHRQTAIATGSTLSYVKDSQPYGVTHDCNHLTAECLREMGCKISGHPFWSNFEVVAVKP